MHDMPTAVVSGGAGFLGSHLCDYLLAKGHRVICLDNLDTGSLQNIEHLRNGEDFLFVNHDVTEPFFIEERVDFIFHLASPASPIDYLRLPCTRSRSAPTAHTTCSAWPSSSARAS